MEPITPAQHNLVLAMVQRAVECWTDHDVERAQGWFEAAAALVGGRDFADTGADK